MTQLLSVPPDGEDEPESSMDSQPILFFHFHFFCKEANAFFDSIQHFKSWPLCSKELRVGFNKTAWRTLENSEPSRENCKYLKGAAFIFGQEIRWGVHRSSLLFIREERWGGGGKAETNNVANISLGLYSNNVNCSKVHRWHLVCGLQPSDLLLKGDLVV